MLLAAVFVLFFLALCGSVVYGVFILYPLLWGLLSVGFVAWSRGYAIGTILRMGYTGAKQSLIVVEVFFHIGALTAAWRAAGTIGFLVHHGLQMLSPGAFLVGCFLLPLAFSVLLGTAIGTVGVIGIALMVIAKAGAWIRPSQPGLSLRGPTSEIAARPCRPARTSSPASRAQMFTSI